MEEKIIAKDVEINERITDAQVRVIDEKGEQLGIMTSSEANLIAEQRNLDLVKIAANGVPPVCKIMDYGKFRFDQVKKEKDARKNQKVSEMKGMWLSMTIDRHDLETKAKHTAKFLIAGDKVKVSIKMRGRQQAYITHGIEVMNDFYEILKDVCVIEKRPLTEGRNILMILSPITKK